MVFVVAGPNSAKAKCVIADALKMQKKKLPKLTLCFIGDPEHEAEVAGLVAAIGGQVPPSSPEKPNLESSVERSRHRMLDEQTRKE